MKKINKSLILALIACLSSCISISKIEPLDSAIINRQSNEIADSDIAIYLPGSTRCIDDSQNEFVKKSIKKYFSVKEGEKVNVYIKERTTEDLGLSVANVIVSIMTLTIIPIYLTASYEFDIGIVRPDQSILHYKYTDQEEGLISVLVVPAMPWRYMYSSRKVNMERAIYLASKSEPEINAQDNEPRYEPTKRCNFPLDFSNRQQW